MTACRSALVILLLFAAASAARADGEAHPALPWKLTVGDYLYRDFAGQDVNLRWRHDDTHVWVGGYRDRVFGSQWRAGADTAFDLTSWLQLQPSVQVAGFGFVGGSLTAQVGSDAWYAYGGIGRTNLRPYFNLNFDPNDALTFGAGHRAENGNVYTVFLVADDRLHTRQRDWHANARIELGGQRATLDVLRKSGISDAGYITAWGASINWDFPRWFLRVARDPYQNFSADSAWRLAAGLRF